MDTLRAWLDRHELGHLAEVLGRNAIGFDVLGRLSEQDMKELGIALGDRYRLRSAIEALDTRDAGAGEAHFRQLTVLFADLVDSTRLSVRLDPEAYRRVLRRYQGAVADVMQRYGGTITRYHGDGVLVVFGYPEAQEDGPDRAVRAGLDAVAAVATLPPAGGMQLAARVGIATGEVVVGDVIGKDLSRQVALSGSTPNLAARLQGLVGAGCVVISRATMRLVTSRLEATELEPARLKGIEQPVSAYVVRGAHEADRFEHQSVRGVTPLIARQVELGQLAQAWAAALEGEGQTTVVSGEAGIGKSRLVNEFLSEVPSPQVLHLFCLPRYQNSTLHPIVRRLRDAIPPVHGADRQARRFQLARVLLLDEAADAQALDVFEAMLAVPSESAVAEDARIGRDQIVAAVLRHLRARVARLPTVILVEDLHWADPTSLDVLERVVSWVPRQPVFLLATTRPDFAPSFIDSPLVRTIKLIRLTRRESMSLIDEIARGHALRGVDRELIVERCDGVPLYLEEVTRAALENVDVSVLERQAVGIPETLRDLLMARLDRLGTGAELAQVASVFGRRFTARQLVGVAQMTAPEIERGLQALQSARIIEPRDVTDEPSYEFSHALTANAAYTSMLRETRRTLHAKVARMLDEDPEIAEREPETAAWHYELAGEMEPAIRLRELAGRRASARSANVEAAHHFQRAVQLAGRLGADSGQLDLELRLRLELATQLIACYGNGAKQVESNFERARELCERVPDRGLRWQALHGLRSCYLVRGRLREARELGGTLLELAEVLEGSGLAIQAHRAHGLCLFALGEFDDARRHLERAVELYDPALHGVQRTGFISDLLVLAKCTLGWLCGFQGERERALALHTEALDYAERLDHKHSLAYALAVSAASHQALGDGERTRELAERLVELSAEQSYPYWLAWGRMLGAWSRALEGEGAALREFDAGLKAYGETDARMMAAYFMTLRAEVDVARECYGDAIARLAEAQHMLDATGARFYEAELARLRAVAYARSSDPSRAREALERALSVARRQGNELLIERIECTAAELARGV